MIFGVPNFTHITFATPFKAALGPICTWKELCAGDAEWQSIAPADDTWGSLDKDESAWSIMPGKKSDIERC